MVAVGLLYGEITAKHYEADIAMDRRIDVLRKLMIVEENESFSLDYLDANKRSIGNSVQVFFDDGSSSEKVPRSLFVIGS